LRLPWEPGQKERGGASSWHRQTAIATRILLAQTERLTCIRGVCSNNAQGVDTMPMGPRWRHTYAGTPCAMLVDVAGGVHRKWVAVQAVVVVACIRVVVGGQLRIGVFQPIVDDADDNALASQASIPRPMLPDARERVILQVPVHSTG